MPKSVNTFKYLFQQQLNWQTSTALTQPISLLVNTGADNSIEKLIITFDDALGDVRTRTFNTLNLEEIYIVHN